MQNAAFASCGIPECYGKIRVAPDELAEFAAFARTNLAGFNVTVPHKQAILPFLDRIDADAERCGSVNTVRIAAGQLEGFSTDGAGILYALQSVLQVTVKEAVITMVGAGGAAHAAAFALQKAGVKRLFIANRTKSRAENLAQSVVSCAEAVPMQDLRCALQQSGCLLQCSSCGLRETDGSPFDLELLNGLFLSVFDMIYRRTELLDFAEKRGFPCASGKEMLIGQGAASFYLWTGRRPSLESMRRGFEKEMAG